MRSQYDTDEDEAVSDMEKNVNLMLEQIHTSLKSECEPKMKSKIDITDLSSKLPDYGGKFSVHSGFTDVKENEKSNTEIKSISVLDELLQSTPYRSHSVSPRKKTKLEVGDRVEKKQPSILDELIS